MQASFGLYQEQRMKLHLTPELKQAIHILQYSSLELAEYINQQMAENPLINPSDSYYLSATTKKVTSSQNVSEFNPIDRAVSFNQTLETHLLEQLSVLPGLSPNLHKIAKFIIGNLDSQGYLEMTIGEVAQFLDADPSHARQALKIVQSLEPRGVGAGDLQECLMIQLECQGLGESLAYEIIRDYMPHLAAGKIEKIAAALKVSPSEVQQAVDLIRTLNPRPGAAYSRDDSYVIHPDVIVRKLGHDYIVTVNDSVLPELSINRDYTHLRQAEGEVRTYIQGKMKEAMWLINSIQQRKLTLYRVTEAIVGRQMSFFDIGNAGLKPMTLKEIAEQLGVHESTVSRATANKFVQTPRGTYELKFFFTSSLQTTDGDAASSEAVKQQIRTIIETEDRLKPLSDQRIAEILERQGTTISRRTVAKYREEMGIPASAMRKRY